MKRVSLLVAAIAALGALTVVSSASAAGVATYNFPAKTGKLTSGIVGHYSECTSGPYNHRPSQAFPGCDPFPGTAEAHGGNTETFRFGSKAGKLDGVGTFTIAATKGDVKLAAKSKDIEKCTDAGAPGGADIFTACGDAGFTSSPGPVPPDNRLQGTAIVRATDTGCDDPGVGGIDYSVSCTVEDFDFPVKLNCTAGTCVSAFATADAVTAPVDAVQELDSANIEVGAIQVEEFTPDGMNNRDVIAQQGLFVK